VTEDNEDDQELKSEEKTEDSADVMESDVQETTEPVVKEEKE